MVGIVAGEASGDNLGAPLMAAIRKRLPDARFVGVGGQRMLEEGLHPLASIDELSVNGLVQPLFRLPSLYSLLLRLERALEGASVVVGVDFNVFNLLLERRVKRSGTPTAHYVSPSVYAWRRDRIKRIGRSADVVMTLFPFEPAIYRAESVRAEFVGHPLARAVPSVGDRAKERSKARSELDLDSDGLVIALMPGSRSNELRHMGRLFLKTAGRFARMHIGERVEFLVPCVRERAAQTISAMSGHRSSVPVRTVVQDTLSVLRASDAALVKAGTGTLEALLTRTPMVVTYRSDPISFAVVKRMLHTEFLALPNILAGQELVPEFWQDIANPENLALALRDELNRARMDPAYFRRFAQIHEELSEADEDRAAEIVVSLIA